VGCATSVKADVAAARVLRPGAVLLGAKYAVVLYQEIEHVWTQHIEQAADIRARAGRRVFIHSRSRIHQRRRLPGLPEKGVDYVWPTLEWVNGGSGFAAALWARHGMGFDEVILCGVPLDPGGYAPEIAAFKAMRGDGGKSFVDTRALARWRDVVAAFVANGRAAGITSMSGWTRGVLGMPA
jgi:hypothetical protein